MTAELLATARQLAAEHYALTLAAAEMLPGERDHNVLLTDTQGQRWVLKMMHEQCPPQTLDLQVQVHRYLAAHPDLAAVPRLRPTPCGKDSLTISHAGAAPRQIWMIKALPGRVLAQVKPHDDHLLAQIGASLACLDQALAGFTHPQLERPLKWNLLQADWLDQALASGGAELTSAQRQLLQRQWRHHRQSTLPRLRQLPSTAIHGDANDYNLLVEESEDTGQQLSGIIDFGDCCAAPRICELAIACAYIMLDKADPLAAALVVAEAYHRHAGLSVAELELLADLIRLRLCVSAISVAQRKNEAVANPYLKVSEAAVWRLLHQLNDYPAAILRALFCALRVEPGAAIEFPLIDNRRTAPLCPLDLRQAPVLDHDLCSLAVDSPEQLLTLTVAAPQRPAVGRYAELRPGSADTGAPASGEVIAGIHCGLEVYLPSATPVTLPLAGRLCAWTQSDDGVTSLRLHCQLPLDDRDHPAPCWLQISGLVDVRPALAGGAQWSAGTPLGQAGEQPVRLQLWLLNGTDEMDVEAGLLPFQVPTRWWPALAPRLLNPASLLGLKPAALTRPHEVEDEPLTRRRRYAGAGLSLAYQQPLHLLRGWRHHLYDNLGQRLLDAYNNVPHVGHCHPRVVTAIHHQLKLLNTNTRYLYDSFGNYVERLCALLPEPLSVCYLLNSGSEANELALRLARSASGRHHGGMVVLEHGYHGHTSNMIELSHYKHAGAGGRGSADWIWVAPQPDAYRDGLDPASAGGHYAAALARVIERGENSGRPLTGFIADTYPSVGGQLVLPPGYLSAVYECVRQHGGLCIADEVQTGFGRTGDQFWGFTAHQVVPDIVVLGKPMANGYPLAAVVTTPAIAQSFDNGMEFFSTFGGNCVACAAGMAVLEVLEQEQLQDNARRQGRRLAAGLRGLAKRSRLLGDIRGCGLFWGVELVRDRDSREPATTATAYIVNRLAAAGVLIGSDGPHHNVLKIRPPMCFDDAAADRLLSALEAILCGDSRLAPYRH
ncbi:MAG: aminotransferase class III-fold pyridoxal phosphate-dependent enzyme [Wenzhouxiangellaceae bacterium]